MRLGYIFTFCLLGMALPALAGEVPRYEPSPAWIDILPTPTANDPNAPSLVLSDMQQRVEGARLWSYYDTAVRASSPEALAKLTSLTLPWTPDKGDLIIHELSILRGGERIDLLASGQKFTVMRREEALEQREVTGILTATLQVEGLQVGDTLRLRLSRTATDTALGGHVQGGEVVKAEPIKIGQSRLRLSWPTATPVQWKLLADGATPQFSQADKFTTLELKLPLVKQPDMPPDAPLRFRHPLLFEFSNFRDWRQVSQIMAPLYDTAGLIAPGSPLAAEVAAIEKADPTPLGRAELALQLVQDKVRYLAIVMSGGNYVPQAPTRTWQLRYGDCKAKTLLLLALLHSMDIAAEPVLASSQWGDLVPDRRPSAAAFDHVLVRADMAGQSLWLDGTRSNARLADIHDTPGFRHVLPVRSAGSELLTIVTHAEARPTIDYTIDADESTSSDLPSAVAATAVLRGGLAARMIETKGNTDDKTLREGARKMFQPILGEDFQVADVAIVPDPAAGTAAVVVHGEAPRSWTTEDRKLKRNLLINAEKQPFNADRTRPAWTTIPVASQGTIAVHYHLRVHLPDSGKGVTIEGDPDVDVRVAGGHLVRHVAIAGGIADFDERIDSTGQELPAAQIPAMRAVEAGLLSRQPRLVAAQASLRWWNITAADRARGTQLPALAAAYKRMIANDPDEVYGLASLSYVHELALDRKAAVADLNLAIAKAPSVDLYLRRETDQEDLGELDLALADADAARALDPSSQDATDRAAWLMSRQGHLAGAVALLDEQIAKGGKVADDYSVTKALAIGLYGDLQEGLRQVDALIAKKPGAPGLLDNRCWIKGARAVMLDTALKDCTSAIELSSDSSSPLDSRAMVWFRMGRFDDALRDLDAVLADNPGYAQSLFLRSIVLKRLHRDAEAATDLQAARNLSPSIDRNNAAYGLVP